MRMQRVVAVLAILAVLFLATSAWAQGGKVYFSVSTSKTFAPGEKPKVRLFARNVDALEFRVYKVHDALAFFERLQDVHSFGPQHLMRERIDERTWLERFHDWKHDTWVGLRNFFRHQFSAESREAIRERHAQQAQRSNVSGATQFAQVPLLNSQQLVARWRVTLPPKYVSESSDLPLDSLPAGTYVVEVTDGTYRAYTVLLVTRMVLVTKTSPGQVVAFTADRKTGETLGGATVTVWRQKAVAAQFKTADDGAGEARFNAPKLERSHAADVGADEEEDFVGNAEWVLAQRGDDVALVAPYSLSLSSDPASDWLGYVYTERPVYRPGHTVQFKAILRKRNGDAIQLPTEREAEVVITDVSDNQVYKKTLPLSPMGSLHGSLDLPATAALGGYSIRVSNGQGSAMGSFEVEEYKKPEYFVKVTPSRPRVLQGDKVTATIEARYFFGEPVANAKVHYVVHTSRAWFWDEEEEDTGGEPGAEGGEGGFDYGGSEILDEDGKLDAEGRLTISIPTKFDAEHPYDANYRIEARVTDAANREIAGHNAVLATYGSFHLDAQAQSYVYKQGDTAQVTVRAMDYDKHGVRTRVHVELVQHWWNRKADDRVIRATEVDTGADGNGTAQLSLPESGSFTVRATATTPEGRKVESHTWLWVTGPNEESWGEGERNVQIVADKPSYKPGETAHVLVMTGVPSASVLITSEGRTVMEKRVVHATSQSFTVDIPITQQCLPNFYVSAVFAHDDNIYTGTKSIKVPPVEQRLNIEIVPAKSQFLPGETASYDLKATDVRGNPVQAELSVGIVDEAIYSVRPESSGDILNAFYEKRYGAINTENSLEFYFSGEAGTKSLHLARLQAPWGRRALAQVKNSEMVQPKVRKAFPDTAFWSPEVRTDASGHATVKMTFPDSLTTWRTTVRAVTADTKAGFAINKVLVRKNLIVRLAVPRFFRSGDEVTVSALVHNYLETDKVAHVSLETSGVTLLSGGPTDVTVPVRGDVKVDYRLRALPGATVRLLVKALTDQESDAMELTLPVVPFGVKQSVNASGSIGEQAATRQTKLDYPASEASTRGMDLELAPSVTGGVFDALEYLTSYPYGCTEQTMSSFLPNVLVTSVMRELKVQTKVDPAVLRRQVDQGLARLYDFQHEDGGWGWWKEDDSMVFMTAYVVYGLARAKDAGYPVQEWKLNKGEEFLKTALKEHPRMIADLRAYVVFALAEAGVRDKKMLDDLWDVRGKFSPEGLALAGLAMQASGDARAGDAVNTLRALAKTEGDAVYWENTSDSLMEIEEDTDAEATAYAVKLLSRVSPTDELLPKAVQWLMRHRNEGYYWSSTKQTAMVIFGISEYLLVSHELDANFDAEVLVNGRSLLKRHFTADDARQGTAGTLHLDASQVAGSNQVEVKKSGAGRLYWSARAGYYSTDKRLYRSGSYSLNIARDYYRLRRTTASDGRFVYDLDPLNGPAQTGDVLAVKISVSGGKWKYLLIEDPIPAGTEFIDRADLYELRDKPSWWGFWWTRREFHDDRAAIFQTYFSDHQEYVYLLKVVNGGTFKVSPASVQPMYQPQVLSTTEPAGLEVK